MLNNLKLTLDSNRKLLSVECDDFRIKLNGNTNDAYRKLFKELGLEIAFDSDPTTTEPNAQRLVTRMGAEFVAVQRRLE